MNTKQKKQDLPLCELDLSFRSYRCLSKAGIQTVADLVKLTSTDILDIEKLNWKSVEEIEKKLGSIGLSLMKEENRDF